MPVIPKWGGWDVSHLCCDFQATDGESPLPWVPKRCRDSVGSTLKADSLTVAALSGGYVLAEIYRAARVSKRFAAGIFPRTFKHPTAPNNLPHRAG